MQRAGKKATTHRIVGQKARPMNPVQLSRQILGDKVRKVFINEMRDKYSIIDLVQLEVPEGLADDVRGYLSQFYDGEEAFYDFKGNTDDDREYVVKLVQENREAVVDVLIGFILRGRYEPVPREMLGKITVQDIVNKDGTVAPIIHIIGSALTDWRRLVKEIVETADRVYGRPAPGRRRGSDMFSFAEDCMARDVTDPRQMALDWVESDPVKYPLRESSEELAGLSDTFRKICRRLEPE